MLTFLSAEAGRSVVPGNAPCRRLCGCIGAAAAETHSARRCNATIFPNPVRDCRGNYNKTRVLSFVWPPQHQHVSQLDLPLCAPASPSALHIGSHRNVPKSTKSVASVPYAGMLGSTRKQGKVLGNIDCQLNCMVAGKSASVGLTSPMPACQAQPGQDDRPSCQTQSSALRTAIPDSPLFRPPARVASWIF